MAEVIEWLPDGTPYSPRFGDRYRSERGGLAQSREVFLHGCGLPAAWAGRAQWCILETGFGLGLNFLVTWQAWKADPARPRLLHFVSTEAFPASAADILRAAAAHPELMPLATQLQAQCWGLQPGLHRLVFEEGRVLLSLCIGDTQAVLREQRFAADAVYLDGFSPAKNPGMWDLSTFKAVARCCRRGTRIASWTIARTVLDGLAQCGFAVRKTPGLPPKRDNLQGEFDPRWEPRKAMSFTPVAPSSCVVIGGGLAGAASAASLARRGWQVTVLDMHAAPAGGASGLPAGVLVPHVSPDDSLLSRLSRCGVRATLQQAEALLQEGSDWQASGVLERRLDGSSGLPADWPQAGRDWSEPAQAAQMVHAGLGGAAGPACWHHKAGWIKPARLVQALLAHPGITWRGGVEVGRLDRNGNGNWLLWNTQAQLAAQAPVVVLAAAYTSRLLAGGLPLQAIRGQMSWGLQAAGVHGRRSAHPPFPPFPVNGHGSFIPAVPTGAGPIWLAGAGFERDSDDTRLDPQDQQANLARLRTLLPAAARQLAPAFEDGTAQAWAGVRCASPDRLPVAGALDEAGQPGLWVCTAMGSRGLTFALLCGEIIAARMHGEPLPLEEQMARALAPQRLRR